ncbi:MAG: uridine kinase [Actinomycetota bacterium]|jgi:uridine kinase|nr:uridine kinase [Actinomycetota bacterium]MDQ1668785.1 uridine kinase [Actinomycetota bacterium]
MTRDELLVELAARVLALADDRPRLVAIDGMSGVGKTSLAADLATVVGGAGRHVVRVSYDDFHQPRQVRHRAERLSAEGYLTDSYDPGSLRRLVLDPAVSGAAAVVPGSFDLANDEPITPEPVPLEAGTVVLVEGEFLLAPDFDDCWDVGVLLVAEPAALLARALERDADLGPADQVRELYLRRYLGAWALHEERHDPWRRADVVVDLTDPQAPRRLG